MAVAAEQVSIAAGLARAQLSSKETACIKRHMIRIASRAFDTAIEKMSALPPAERDRIARWLLGEL